MIFVQGTPEGKGIHKYNMYVSFVIVHMYKHYPDLRESASII